MCGDGASTASFPKTLRFSASETDDSIVRKNRQSPRTFYRPPADWIFHRLLPPAGIADPYSLDIKYHCRWFPPPGVFFAGIFDIQSLDMWATCIGTRPNTQIDSPPPVARRLPGSSVVRTRPGAYFVGVHHGGTILKGHLCDPHPGQVDTHHGRHFVAGLGEHIGYHVQRRADASEGA